MAKAEYRSAVRSRKMIKDALADLLQEKPLDKLTVTDIINRAGINRGTFYAHYKDIPDLIDHLIQEMFLRITEALRESPHDLMDIPGIMIREIHSIMEEDYSFYQKLTNSASADIMRVRLTEVVMEYMLSQETRYSIADHDEYVMMTRFCAGGMTSLYQDWFSGKIPLSLAELSARMEKMIGKLLT